MNIQAFANLDDDELQVVYRSFPPGYHVHTQNLHHFDTSMSWFQNILAYSAWHLKCGRIHVSSSEDRLRLANKQLAFGIAENACYLLAHSYFKMLLDGWTKELQIGLTTVLGAYVSVRLQDNYFGFGKEEQLEIFIDRAIRNGIERDTGVASGELANVNKCLAWLHQMYASSSIDESEGGRYLELCSGLTNEALIAVQTVYGVCERVEAFWSRERRRI